MGKDGEGFERAFVTLRRYRILIAQPLAVYAGDCRLARAAASIDVVSRIEYIQGGRDRDRNR